MTVSSQDLPFIISNGPKVDPAVRTVIRKQAMKDVGIFRKKIRSAQVNPQQRPLRPVPSNRPWTANSVHDDVSDISRSTSISRPFSSPSRASSPNTETRFPPIHIAISPNLLPYQAFQCVSVGSVPNSLSANPEYEVARQKFGVDITSLSTLTSFNINKSGITLISADPRRLASLLTKPEQQWSFLEHVPARYGSSECIAAAADCLLAKLQTVLSPQQQSACSSACDVLYGRALRSLQGALTGENSSAADVLAAMQLLSMRELLDPGRDEAWSHHVNGSARLITHRSSKRFTSDFEKALFASHIGAMVSETLLSIQHCYLEQPEWVDLYSSMAQDSYFLTSRSQLTIDMRKTLFAIPGLWRDIDDWVNSEELFTCVLALKLGKTCRRLHQELVKWLRDYKLHCSRISLAELPSAEIALRRELFGSAITCLLIVKRLLATVSDTDRPRLEAETQALAHSILNLQDEPQPKHSWLWIAHEVSVARVTILTHEEWQVRNDDLTSKDAKLSIRNRYNRWTRTMRMQEPDG